MKIEAPKNTQSNDVQRNRVGLNQSNSTNSFGIDEMDDVPTNFADIFESVLQREDETEKKNNNNTEKVKEDDKSNSPDGHKRVSEKKDDSEGDTGGNAETNAGLSSWQSQFVENKQFIGENVPARAILHIADVERIVSSVRTNILENGLPQIVIDLKRSILEGLQIRLSTDQNGKIVAEFIASSEKVKAQIDAKNKELAEILANRGIPLASVKTTLNSDFSGDKNPQQQNESAFEYKTSKVFAKSEMLEIEEVKVEVSKNVYRA